jgi:hypothetical protein
MRIKNACLPTSVFYVYVKAATSHNNMLYSYKNFNRMTFAFDVFHQIHILLGFKIAENVALFL